MNFANPLFQCRIKDLRRGDSVITPDQIRRGDLHFAREVEDFREPKPGYFRIVLSDGNVIEGTEGLGTFLVDHRSWSDGATETSMLAGIKIALRITLENIERANRPTGIGRFQGSDDVELKKMLPHIRQALLEYQLGLTDDKIQVRIPEEPEEPIDKPGHHSCHGSGA